MTIGKITASSQDTVFVKVRAEDDSFIETHDGSTETTYNIIATVGQIFTTTRWSGRLKIKLGSVGEAGNLRVLICDSPAKTKIYYENGFKITTLGGQVLHMAYDPLPPGTYYFEIQVASGSFGVSVITDSTLHKSYKEGSPTTDWDIMAKVMYVTDAEEERAIAVIGDEVDSGVTTVSSGSQLGRVKVGLVEKNISREGDSLANGGSILTSSYFMEMED